VSAEQNKLEVNHVARARMMLQAAEWAASELAAYDRAAVQRIVDAVARAAFDHAAEYAEWAVRETGFGVVEHKRTKNEIASLGIAEHYSDSDFVTPKVLEELKIIEVPRPAGVVFALTPSTNPVSTLYFKVILALMTRNAIVVSPHPLAVECCIAATRTLAEAAARAGAPRDSVQIVDEPSIPLIEALMEDTHTKVIVATGGTGVVRAAYRSGNPALGVGPGNAPVVVDHTADLGAAAGHLVESKAFDNSLLCSSESVLIAEEVAAEPLLAAMRRAGAHICTPEERDRLREFLIPEGRLNIEVVGKDASWVARGVGLRVAPRTRVLVAPIDLVVEEEPLAHEKMCPVLAFHAQPDIGAVIKSARAVLRIAGAGHSAAIHSTDPAHVMAFADAVNVLRVVVNAANSTGVAGFDTNLAPTMTVGTGFTGRSSVGENFGPQHLVNWCRVAYNKDPSVAFPDFAGTRPWERANVLGARAVPDSLDGSLVDDQSAALREQIRTLVIEELHGLVEVH
jgi:acyl-CoA reductase-like NAD-dependent aldehyde dehydrogenase